MILRACDENNTHPNTVHGSISVNKNKWSRVTGAATSNSTSKTMKTSEI